MTKIFTRLLFMALLFAGATNALTAQSLVFRQFIMFTDTIEDDGVIFPASSDDAEQENDEMDSLFDDDLDAGWEGAPDDQNVLSTGLRFRHVGIPKGAIIDSAFIRVFSHEDKSTADVARVTIFGEKSLNAETFTEDALITDRPRTTASVLWEVKEEWEIWKPYHTADIKTVVQEIVDQDGWETGNALSILMLGENQGLSDDENAREFESFENISDPEDGGDGQNHPERIPELIVYFRVSNARLEIPIAFTGTFEDDGVVFEGSSDDAEQENDEMDSLYDDDVDAGWEGDPTDQNILTAGLRFRNVLLPKGAVIDSAFIQVWSHESKSEEDVARITLVGEANDLSATFTEDALISDRPKTTASLLWEVKEKWELWGKYQTPDLKAIVSEIAARPGWVSGNPMTFLMLGENQGLSDVENAREFESYENIADPEDGGDGQNHPERRPRLVIYYSSATTSSQTPELASDFYRVYPNPNRGGQLFVEIAEPQTTRVWVLDATGKMVAAPVTTEGGWMSLPTGGWNKGIYFLMCQNSSATVCKKVIIH
jgi:hypothetical protein